jgi:hypothetical protein
VKKVVFDPMYLGSLGLGGVDLGKNPVHAMRNVSLGPLAMVRVVRVMGRARDRRTDGDDRDSDERDLDALFHG